jgi:hypothetical protein
MQQLTATLVICCDAQQIGAEYLASYNRQISILVSILHSPSGEQQQYVWCRANCTQMLADFSSAYNNRPDLSEVLEAGSTAAAADLQSARRVYHTHQR